MGKIVATVKCEDLHEVVPQDSFLVGSCRRRQQNYPHFSKVAISPSRVDLVDRVAFGVKILLWVLFHPVDD